MNMYSDELQNIDNGIIDDVGIILKVGLDKNIISPSSSSNPDDHYYGVGIRNYLFEPNQYMLVNR